MSAQELHAGHSTEIYSEPGRKTDCFLEHAVLHFSCCKTILQLRGDVVTGRLFYKNKPWLADGLLVWPKASGTFFIRPQVISLQCHFQMIWERMIDSRRQTDQCWGSLCLRQSSTWRNAFFFFLAVAKLYLLCFYHERPKQLPTMSSEYSFLFYKHVCSFSSNLPVDDKKQVFGFHLAVTPLDWLAAAQLKVLTLNKPSWQLIWRLIFPFRGCSRFIISIVLKALMISMIGQWL